LPLNRIKSVSACPSRQTRIGFIRDSAFWFYYLGGDMDRMRFESAKTAGKGARRVWIVERMRGDTTLTRMPRLDPSFPSSYRLVDVHPFQPIDERKRRMYSRLRGKDVGGHYIEVRVYERMDIGESRDKETE